MSPTNLKRLRRRRRKRPPNSQRSSEAGLGRREVIDSDPSRRDGVALSLDEDDPAPLDVMDRAGELLSRRARSAKDLGDRLRGSGFDDGDVDAALSSLRRLGLVNDAAFAREWLESRQGPRALGKEAILVRLESKGVDREVAAEALEASGYDETAAAAEVAAAHIGRMSHLAPIRQAARLGRLLAGRGFEPEAAEAAISDLMPPEGWD